MQEGQVECNIIMVKNYMHSWQACDLGRSLKHPCDIGSVLYGAIRGANWPIIVCVIPETCYNLDCSTCTLGTYIVFYSLVQVIQKCPCCPNTIQAQSLLMLLWPSIQLMTRCLYMCLEEPTHLGPLPSWPLNERVQRATCYQHSTQHLTLHR